jgi:hypothetical protein
VADAGAAPVLASQLRWTMAHILRLMSGSLHRHEALPSAHAFALPFAAGARITSPDQQQHDPWVIALRAALLSNAGR